MSTCPPIIQQGELKQRCTNVRCDEKFFYGICNNLGAEQTFPMEEVKDCENKNGSLITGRFGKIICTDKQNSSKLPWWAILLIIVGVFLVVGTIVMIAMGTSRR